VITHPVPQTNVETIDLDVSTRKTGRTFTVLSMLKKIYEHIYRQNISQLQEIYVKLYPGEFLPLMRQLMTVSTNSSQDHITDRRLDFSYNF
jgi:hypothetical protein